MKVYEGANIRNVAVVGHGHAGKTSLVSAMLYTSGATPRLGRVDDGCINHGQHHLGFVDKHVEAGRVHNVDLGLAPFDVG